MKLEICGNTAIAIGSVMSGIVLCVLIVCGFYFPLEKAKAAFAAGLSEQPDHSNSTHYSK